MKKNMNYQQNGFTLVEVLAALVILGILFTGFMTIFPQMTLFNEKTEVKLDTMSLIREELVVVQNNSKWREDPEAPAVDQNADGKLETDEYIHFFMTRAGYTRITSPLPSDFRRYEKTDDYRFEADVALFCTEMLNGTCAEKDPIRLHKIHLKAFNGTRLSSETYGYASIVTAD